MQCINRVCTLKNVNLQDSRPLTPEQAEEFKFLKCKTVKSIKYFFRVNSLTKKEQ